MSSGVFPELANTKWEGQQTVHVEAPTCSRCPETGELFRVGHRKILLCAFCIEEDKREAEMRVASDPGAPLRGDS